MIQEKDIVFATNDFNCFAKQFHRKREYNQFRLKVRRKLGDLGACVLPMLKDAGLSLVAKTSLHHPYSYNSFAVDSQWVYFSPASQTLHHLKKILGTYVGADLDSHYTHTLLVIGIQQSGIYISLKIHPQAWWDGQNFKNKCGRREQQSLLLSFLHKLDNFYLKLHDWPNKYCCNDITIDDLKNYLRYYTPGEHWLHLDYEIARETPVATSPDLVKFAAQQLLSLVAIYRFITWAVDNNYVFKKK